MNKRFKVNSKKKYSKKQMLELTKSKELLEENRMICSSIKSVQMKKELPQQSQKDDDIDGFSSSDSDATERYSSKIWKESTARKNISNFELVDFDETEKIAWSDSSIENLQSAEERASVDEFDDINAAESSSARNILNVSIKDYDSENEGPIIVVGKKVDDSRRETSQDTIDMLSPSPVPLKMESVLLSNKTEMFNMAENIDNNNNDETESESAKKKKRVVKGGLVERLQKLVAKEKSDLAFWKHDLKKKTDESVSLEVESLQNSFSVSTISCRLSSGMKIYVLLPQSLMKDIHIATGSKFRIFPPWKKMFCKDLKTVVLLCTYYFEVLPKEAVISNCPAEEELIAFHQKYCKLLASNQESPIDECAMTNLKTTHVTENTVSQSKHDSIHQAVEKHGYSGLSCFCGRIQRVFYREKNVSKDASKTFIQKLHVLENIADKDEIRYTLLVQDKDFVLAEVEVQETILKENSFWMKAVTEGEGKLCTLVNVKLVKRISYNRSPITLSMMKTFFPENSDSTQPSNRTSQDIQDVCTQHLSSTAPSYSYVFHAGAQSMLDFHDVPEDIGINYISSLTSCNSITDGRFSVHVKIITITCSVGVENIADMLNVNCRVYCYSIMSDQLICVRKLSACTLSNRVKQVLIGDGTDIKENSVYMKDLRMINGEIVADMYTQIKLQVANTNTSINELSIISCAVKIPVPRIPSLDNHVKEGDLVVIKGVICGVDEETALFWNVCDTCGSDEIGQDNERNIWCNTCNCSVSSKVRMQLDVFLYIHALPQLCILCKLMETTISTLLPKPSDTIFEGYDVGSILNKPFSSKLCVVVDVVEQKSSKQYKGKIFLKEVEPLCRFICSS